MRIKGEVVEEGGAVMVGRCIIIVCPCLAVLWGKGRGLGLVVLSHGILALGFICIDRKRVWFHSWERDAGTRSGLISRCGKALEISTPWAVGGTDRRIQEGISVYYVAIYGEVKCCAVVQGVST